MTMFRMGARDLEMGSRYLGTLRESNDLLGNMSALRARMEEDGYLLIRSLQPVEKVSAARQELLENLNANGQLDTQYPLMEGIVSPNGRGAFLGGSKSLTRTPSFLSVVESPEIMGFFADFFESDVLTFDYKWLRVVGPGDFTGAHYDIVYMGRGTQNLYTCWTPLGDITMEMGPLAILVGSHRFERIRETYGQMDVDRDNVAGWFSNDPIELVDKFGGQWQTTEFQMGDVLIFGMFTMHGSLNNVSNRYRLTTDTRYQRADEPVDERWIGDNPMAHYAWGKGEVTPMEVMRERWHV